MVWAKLDRPADVQFFKLLSLTSHQPEVLSRCGKREPITKARQSYCWVREIFLLL
jgi:hypothetical protein